jgi:hypothetical protein
VTTLINSARGVYPFSTVYDAVSIVTTQYAKITRLLNLPVTTNEEDVEDIAERFGVHPELYAHICSKIVGAGRDMLRFKEFADRANNWLRDPLNSAKLPDHSELYYNDQVRKLLAALAHDTPTDRSIINAASSLSGSRRARAVHHFNKSGTLPWAWDNPRSWLGLGLPMK